ncbi:alpha/beta-hydrolase [Gonapodya prolifera JEL478]|uniref:Alpha/beta-hydrolase n=1 Tax=Gonapodya prolifera (strain JEL478) TaxID=1344416 RepID=A0A139ATJ3_GONPJ|nr:alpha/beta-hydrolase [Gonapodya prolifera JEL478]|eukprot:KXS20048.1 alpha/beta-hydrolase [Gonapodya prolifera JEL478]
MTVFDPTDISAFPPLKSALTNGVTTYYADIAPPPNKTVKGTILFVHGFPEFWFEWRHQLVHFSLLGYRCIAPNTRGYNGNEPKAAQSDRVTRLAHFSYGKAAADLDALLEHLGIPSCIVVGHDWGSLLVQRFVSKYPARVQRLVLLTIPYIPPPTEYVPLEIQAQAVPMLRYQLYFNTDKSEREINARPEDFVNIFFRPGGDAGGIAASVLASIGPEDGNGIFELFPEMTPSTLMTEKEKKAYVDFYKSIGGMNGPLQWYRMGEASFDEFKDAAMVISVDTLFVGAQYDPFSSGPFLEPIKAFFPNLTMKEVKSAGHWVAHERPAEVNEAIESWLATEPKKGSL